MDEWIDIGEPVKGAIPVRLKAASSSTLAASYYKAVEQGALSRLNTHSAQASPIFYADYGNKQGYSMFLKSLAPGLKQEYTCSACKRFVDRYGNLALVDEAGELEPLFWSLADLTCKRHIETFGPSTIVLRNRFKGARVIEEFKVHASRAQIGTTADNPAFSHFHMQFPASRIRKEELPGFTSANTSELATMLHRILDDYDVDTVRTVDSMLQENKLPYADNHKASARWLLEMMVENKIGRAATQVGRHNLLYRYAAASFAGSLHQMRSGALGTLLEYVQEGCSWSVTLDAWIAICDPVRYMRPVAAPSQGNINAAERLFAELGLTKQDLRRRLLVQDDVPAEVVMWASEKMKSRRETGSSSSIFNAVVPKNKIDQPSREPDTPSVKITFTRFVTKVLPKAKRVDCWLDSNTTIGTCITGLAGSRPLMPWHDDQGKNLASHYVWLPPPTVSNHNLRPHAWNEVRCLVPHPPLWDGAPLTTTFPLVDPDGKDGDRYRYYHRSKGFRYTFVLEDNHESRLSHLKLFPQDLKGDFHGVRSTIEAYARTEYVEDVDDGRTRGGFVAGVDASRSRDDQNLKLRVQHFNRRIETYQITLFE